MPVSIRTSSVLLALLSLCYLSQMPHAMAATDTDIQTLQESLNKQEALVQDQQKVLSEQKEKLALQEKEIQDQRAKLEDLIKYVSAGAKKEAEAAKADQLLALQNAKLLTKEEQKKAVGAGAPTGEATGHAGSPLVAPKKEEHRPEVAALANAGGVLTPKGVLIYENSPEYLNTTSNLFTFDGVKLADIVFLGDVKAITAKRQVVQDSNRFRLGITNRLEADIRVPYVYRIDNTTETSGTSTTRTTIKGSGLGDVDAGLSYQINRGQNEWPYFVANTRFKADNAKGPFDVSYDASQIATSLPTGTGFKSVEGSLTAIKVSDPAVLFANLGYVHTIGESIDKTFGTTRVQDVNPGGAINASGGMGFSINQETSFTLGYKHSYVFETTQTGQNLSTGVFTKSKSDTASVGSLLVGSSYRINPITSINMNVEVGATRDAPDVRVGFRVPIRLGTLF